MKRRFMTSSFLGVAFCAAVLLTACASTMTPTAERGSVATQAGGAYTAPAAGGQSTPLPNGTAPSSVVTAGMRSLGLSGEAYAVLGDPNAPIMMVEWGDYG